jgi:hypothetical protein
MLMKAYQAGYAAAEMEESELWGWHSFTHAVSHAEHAVSHAVHNAESAV